MKIFQGHDLVKLTDAQILSMGTGYSEDECQLILTLRKRAITAERDRDFWRDLAISAQQKLEALEKNVTA